MDKKTDTSDPGKMLDYKTPEIFKNKRFLVIAGLLILLAFAGSIYGMILLAGRTASETVVKLPDQAGSFPADLAQADVVEVLPQQKRFTDPDRDNTWPTYNQFIDPFAEPMKLTGVVVGGRGGTMAIIEAGGASYIVSVGDYVDDLWAVYRITRTMVVLRAQNQEVSLFFDEPPSARSLDYDLNDDREDGV